MRHHPHLARAAVGQAHADSDLTATAPQTPPSTSAGADTGAGAGPPGSGAAARPRSRRRAPLRSGIVYLSIRARGSTLAHTSRPRQPAAGVATRPSRNLRRVPHQARQRSPPAGTLLHIRSRKQRRRRELPRPSRRRCTEAEGPEAGLSPIQRGPAFFSSPPPREGAPQQKPPRDESRRTRIWQAAATGRAAATGAGPPRWCASSRSAHARPACSLHVCARRSATPFRDAPEPRPCARAHCPRPVSAETLTLLPCATRAPSNPGSRPCCAPSGDGSAAPPPI